MSAPAGGLASDPENGGVPLGFEGAAAGAGAGSRPRSFSAASTLSRSSSPGESSSAWMAFGSLNPAPSAFPSASRPALGIFHHCQQQARLAEPRIALRGIEGHDLVVGVQCRGRTSSAARADAARRYHASVSAGFLSRYREIMSAEPAASSRDRSSEPAANSASVSSGALSQETVELVQRLAAAA